MSTEEVVTTRPAGPKPDLIRKAWGMRYNLTEKQYHELSVDLMRQLSHCTSDEARRLIMGKSEKYTEDEMPTLTAALMVRYDETHE